MNDFTYKINEFYAEESRRLIASIAKKAFITINGAEYEYPITNTVIRDGFLKHYIEIEDEPAGNIEKAVLVNENGIPLVTGTGIIEKGDDGWQIAFKMFVKVQEEGAE
ncbi:hypothetical protein [Rummeliibacillus sp. POC4]|uniref:hypothetical protein n=1 Tax=Rummeliibacillus sp. POC4 TaxID=2305899 RepID=UPI000E6622E1|nr:hypothetical protein [Rummeliibacillus sp. POC4]RIJ63595.1 hypothetical protein D1606_14035 [Rummeliibacillus sp. POC4]